MPRQKYRVLLAEDHLLVSEGLAKLLEPDFLLVSTVEDGRALVEAVKEHTPDAAIIDISLPLLNGLDAARKIKKVEPQTKIIFLTMHGEDHYVQEAFKTGGEGYLLKQSAPEELVFAIKEVCQGRIYISPSIARGVLSQALNPASDSVKKKELTPLTPRQVEILQLVVEGKSNKEIATILKLAVKTVEFHKTRIMRTMEVSTIPDLTKIAIAQGIISL